MSNLAQFLRRSDTANVDKHRDAQPCDSKQPYWLPGEFYEQMYLFRINNKSLTFLQYKMKGCDSIYNLQGRDSIAPELGELELPDVQVVFGL